jgi:protein-S-isoprenylcysteine O-methyltransferase Ste14
MSPEDRLAAFLSADAVPARPAVDAVFVAEVMQRVARRELQLKLASAAATAVAAGAVLWVCAPVLNLAVQTLAPVLLPAAGILTLAAAAGLLGGQILMRR